MNTIESQTMRNLQHVNLMGLKDIQLEEASEEIATLTNYIEDLAYELWHVREYANTYNSNVSGHNKAYTSAGKVLMSLPDKFVPFYMV